jgi:hypothetical protein
MRSFLVVLGLATLLPGCTYSVYPILTDADLTKDLDLSGTWRQDTPPGKDDDKKTAGYSFEVAADDTSRYFVLPEGMDAEDELDLRIGKIGDRRFLQFIRSNFPVENGGPLSGLPVYGFARFETRGDELRVFSIDHRQVRKLLLKNDIPFRVYDQGRMYPWIVLTAQTAELQSLIRDSGGKLFRKSPVTFRRIPSPPEVRNEPDAGRADWQGLIDERVGSPPG